MNISWIEAIDGAEQLAQGIRTRFPHRSLPCYLVMGRGGLAVAALLSRFVRIESLLYFPISRLHQTDGERLLSITPFRRQWSTPLGAASVVFMIDDIYDTGITIEHTASSLINAGAVKEIAVVTLYIRKGKRFRQGHHIYHRDAQSGSWLVFPWEVHDPIANKEVPF